MQFNDIRPKFAHKNRVTLLPTTIARLMSESVAIALFAIAIIVAASLLSYHTSDNSWSKLSDDSAQVHNIMGVIGAYCADCMLSMCGYSSAWIVLGFSYLAYIKFRFSQLHINNLNSVFKVSCFIVLVSASTICEKILYYKSSLMLKFNAIGNVLLYCIINHTVPYHDILTNTDMLILFVILCLVLMVVCVSVIVPINWATVAELIGYSLNYLYHQTFYLFTNNKHVVSNNSLPNASIPLSTPNISAIGDIMLTDDQPLDGYKPAVRLPTIQAITPSNTIDHISADSMIPQNTKNPAPIDKAMQNTASMQQAYVTQLPATSLLSKPEQIQELVSPEVINDISTTIENTLAEFGIIAKITNVVSGPVVTLYELMPPKGVRGEKILSLAKDIARGLSLIDVRIVSNVPGKNTICIEVPNLKRQLICLKEILESAIYQQSSKSFLTLALGKDIGGEVVVLDLAKMPHLLVAGTTGSGKSVAINAMILSMLFNATSQQVKFIMIDPKMVELSFYQDIPHLLTPVITDTAQASNALQWAVGEMERRYKIMAAPSVAKKNITDFNKKIAAATANGEQIVDPLSIDRIDQTILTSWPYIVIIIDELADLMMVVGKQIEQFIARLAQKARAVGIHLIIATQRPSVDVITGLIKANIPARISFQVSSKIDSRTILDQMGAEILLGQGDMLSLMPGSGFPRRVHGAFVNDDELSRIVSFLREQGAPNYNEDIIRGINNSASQAYKEDKQDLEQDPIFDAVVQHVTEPKECSISSLQNRFNISHAMARRFIEYLISINHVQRNGKGGFEPVKR